MNMSGREAIGLLRGRVVLAALPTAAFLNTRTPHWPVETRLRNA